jgi:hypothetical protein
MVSWTCGRAQRAAIRSVHRGPWRDREQPCNKTRERLSSTRRRLKRALAASPRWGGADAERAGAASLLLASPDSLFALAARGRGQREPALR